MAKIKSHYRSTFEIRRGPYLILRLEHDSARHGNDEFDITTLERCGRTTLNEIEAALAKRKETRA